MPSGGCSLEQSRLGPVNRLVQFQNRVDVSCVLERKRGRLGQSPIFPDGVNQSGKRDLSILQRLPNAGWRRGDFANRAVLSIRRSG
jgi:hypothetical protein